MGLGFATTIDPTGGQQNPSVGNLLTMLGITLILTTDLHHVAIVAVHESYRVLPPGGLPDIGDVMTLAVRAAAQGFALAVQIAAPFIVFGLLFNLGLGVLARMMPQLQVFFLAVPASIFGGMVVLIAVIGVMMSVFLERSRRLPAPVHRKLRRRCQTRPTTRTEQKTRPSESWNRRSRRATSPKSQRNRHVLRALRLHLGAARCRRLVGEGSGTLAAQLPDERPPGALRRHRLHERHPAGHHDRLFGDRAAACLHPLRRTRRRADPAQAALDLRAADAEV
jgi:hypothetical protein